MVEEDNETVSDSSSSETDSVFCVELVNSVNTSKGAIYVEMLIASKPTKFQVDSGSTVNVIPMDYVPANCELSPCDVTLQISQM